MFTCTGYGAESATGHLAPFDFQRREPKTDDIEILYCGVCRSDLHQIRIDWQNTVYPCVPGHEIVGRITRVGAAVEAFKVGQLAGVGCMVDSCRECEAYRGGGGGAGELLPARLQSDLQQPGQAHRPADLRRLSQPRRGRQRPSSCAFRKIWSSPAWRRCSAPKPRPTRSAAQRIARCAQEHPLPVRARAVHGADQWKDGSLRGAARRAGPSMISTAPRTRPIASFRALAMILAAAFLAAMRQAESAPMRITPLGA